MHYLFFSCRQITVSESRLIFSISIFRFLFLHLFFHLDSGFLFNFRDFQQMQILFLDDIDFLGV